MIEIKNIQPKARKGCVTGVSTDPSKTVYNADIEPGKSIRLYGTYYNKPFNISFQLGDLAEYDSYNLKYIGVIVKITQNTVTINASSTGERNKRLSLYEFSWRNHNYDAEKIAKDNYETSMSI